MEPRNLDRVHAGCERLEHRRAFHVHRFRHPPRIGDRRNAEFGERAAQARGRVAIVVAARRALGTATALAERIERDPVADFEAVNPRSHLDHFAGGFVAKNGGELTHRAFGAQFPFINMQVGAADPARGDFDQQLALAGPRHGRFNQFGAGRGPRFGNRFHRFAPGHVIRPSAAAVKERERGCDAED